MVPAVIVVIHESPDVLFKVSGKIVVFEQDPVLQRLMPSLDLALGLRMIRGTAYMIHLPVFQPIGTRVEKISHRKTNHKWQQDFFEKHQKNDHGAYDQKPSKKFSPNRN